METSPDVAVIGGGFFGCMIGRHLASRGRSVVLLEAGDRLLGRASYNNQARVHNGYHYPRSVLTARRSHANFPRFMADYADCVDEGFAKYYAIARTFSKVTAPQFRIFFEKIGAPIGPAPEAVRALFDPQHVEDVFAVRECVFDAGRLASRMARELLEAGVRARFGWEVLRLDRRAGGGIRLSCRSPEGPAVVSAGQVFNCTYSRLNHVLTASGLPVIPLKHELTEMALIDPPGVLKGLGITVMCGPFFSAMPFPPRGLHTLSHVRYTPHESWSDSGGPARDPYEHLDRASRRSHFPSMVRDSARYVPALAESRHVDSLWEVKTTLPASEADDSRPILMRAHHGLPGLHCVLGAKIDNIYDALDEVDLLCRDRRAG
jgi:glycine/D-amino acid oxidase-like deaminating enzyme